MYLLRLIHVLRLGPASANYGLWAESSSFIHALSVAAFLLVYQSRGIVTETVWIRVLNMVHQAWHDLTLISYFSTLSLYQ